MKYLIIGGGVAGTTAAEYLRKLDVDCEIVLVSEEYHALYSRVLLSKYMNGTVPRERVFLKKDEWYSKNNIEWLAGEVCVRVDTKNKFVELSNGREYPYDKLLIATGGEARTIGDELREVSYLRTLDDADHLLKLIAEQGKDARGGIYGSGFIACEYLNLFKHYSIPTVLAFRSGQFWRKVLTPEVSTLVTKHLIDQGVEVYPNAPLKEFIGDKELTGFETEKGVHEATILGVGVGVSPDFSWLDGSGIELLSGIKTNEFLETNVEDVYAAGDIAEFYDPIVERHVKAGNWMSSMSQGRIVAKTMSGERTAFELVSSYAADVLGLDVIFVGDVSMEHADEVHLVGSVEDSAVTQVFERNGRVVGGVMVNRNMDRAILTNAIKEKQAFSDVKFVTT
jgi:NAD(P)H-nitrite reductase large subunit